MRIHHRAAAQSGAALRQCSFEEAARFGYIGTAYAALRKAGAGPGKTILINGLTGTLGLGATLPRLAAASPAFSALRATASVSPASRRWRRTGSRRWPKPKANRSPIGRARFTGGHGVDAVIDCLGPGTSGTLLMNAIYALRRGGKAINIGGVGEKTVMDVHWMMDNQIEFIGSNWFSVEDGDALAAMARTGTLDLSVFEHVRVPLAEVNRALDGSQFRDGGFTNVVIVP